MLFSGSESNSSTLTFDGVDVMGKRLAEEVCTVCVLPDAAYLRNIFFKSLDYTVCIIEMVLAEPFSCSMILYFIFILLH